MKKSISLLLLGFITMAGVGCLKDEGFDNGEHGLMVSDTKVVSFPEAPKSPLVRGITGQAAALTVAGPTIAIEGVGNAASDITVTLVTDTNIVKAKGLTPLPEGTYSLSTLNPVIKAGTKRLDDLQVSVSKSDLLNPEIRYGVGIRITAASGGYGVAANMKEIIIGFAIKNRYDGVYELTGYHNRVPYTFPYKTEMHLITVGPNSVIFWWPEVESQGHPIGISATSMSWYGDAIAPVIVFNNENGMVTDVYNNPPNPTVITLFTGAGSRVSKWDINTKAITVDWNYNNNPLRAFFDDLKYIGPRP